eukprot:366214-Chlamydomonas_euryale.AAC.8
MMRSRSWCGECSSSSRVQGFGFPWEVRAAQLRRRSQRMLGGGEGRRKGALEAAPGKGERRG